MTKKCDYHQDYGHTIGRCYKLMEDIEKWIQDGYLKHYVSSYHQQGRDIDRTDYRRCTDRDKYQKRYEGKKDVGDSSRRVINTIIDATQEWVTSKSKREDHLRSVYNVNLQPTSFMKQTPSRSIQFTENDVDMIPDDGNDPIVITAGIANFDVKHILIDD